MTYILFNRDYSPQKDMELYNKITFIKENKDIGIEDSMIQIDNIYDEIYKPTRGKTFHTYIFIGLVKDIAILNLLSEIERIGDYLDDMSELNNHFKYNCREMWGDLTNYHSIQFIYSFIYDDDTIFYIKNSIFSKIIGPKETIFNPDTIYLTGRLEYPDFDKLEGNPPRRRQEEAGGEGNEITPIHMYIQKMFSRLFKRGDINIDNIITELETIGFTNTKAKQFINSIDISDISYATFLDNKIIKSYIYDTLLNPSLTHTYSSDHNVLHTTNLPLLYLKDNRDFEHYNVLLSKKEYRLESNDNKILSHFGTLKKNELFFYSFKNIYDISGKIRKKTHFLDGFIRTFFPKIHTDTLDDFLDMEHTNKTDIHTNIEHNNKLNQLMNDVKQKAGEEEIVKKNSKGDEQKAGEEEVLENIKTLQTSILYNLQLPYHIDLEDIYNQLELSYDIPFVKYNNKVNILYKVYKGITIHSDKRNYIPFVSKSQLLDWIHITSYQYDNGSIVPIKGTPANLQYKLKIGNIKQDTTTFGTGTVYKLNKLDGNLISIDICDKKGSILPNVDVEFIREADDVKVGDTIQYDLFKTIYGNIELTKRGQIICRIEWGDILEEENIKKIAIDKLDEFIESIKKLETLYKHRELILLNHPIIGYNKLFYKSYFNYNVDRISYKIDKRVDMNYNKIVDLGNKLYPYIIFINSIFEVEQEVEYFKDGQWNKGRINTLRENGNYDILTGQLGNVEDIDSRQIRNVGITNYRTYIHFKYKRVSNFNYLTPIKQFISNLRIQQKTDDFILNEISRQFSVPLLDAQNILKEQPDQKYLSNLNDIDIKIDYLKFTSAEVVDNMKTLNVYVEGYENQYQLHNIREFIRVFLKLYEYIESGDSGINIDVLRQNIIPDNISDSGSSFVFGDDSDSDSDTDDEEVEIEPMEETIVEVGTIPEVEVEITRGRRANPILQRLYDVDSGLFNWGDKSDKNVYARMCQGYRQPKVLTQTEKEVVDRTFPHSYKENPDDVDCRLDEVTTKPKCGAIYTGSNDMNKHWYICPKIWDLIDNTPLNIDNLNFKGLGYNMSKKDATKKYGKKHYLKKDFQSSISNWRIDKKVKTTDGEDVDIEEFGPTYKGRGVVQKLNKVSTKHSLLLEDTSRPKRYNYPGLMIGKHPGNLPIPCCFQSYSKNVDKVLRQNQPEENASHYIKGADKLLGPNRLGLLPDILYPYFGMDSKTCSTGMLSQKTCFYRVGVKDYSFLSLIASYTEDKKSEDYIIKCIIEKITLEEFRSLNGGYLDVQFTTSIPEITSFQNFLEYTMSPQEKKYEFYYEYLTKPQTWLFKKGILLIILEIENNKVYIECPYLIDIDELVKRRDVKIALAIRTNNTFESIFKYEDKNPVKLFEKTDRHISGLYETFIQKCKSNKIKYTDYTDSKEDQSIKGYRDDFSSKKFYLSTLDIYKVKNECDHISAIYDDVRLTISTLYMNRENDEIRGVILENGLLIEIEPILLTEVDETTLNLNIADLEKTDEYSIPVDDFQNIISKYDKIWKYSNYELPIKPVRNIINDKQITAILLEQGSIIKINGPLGMLKTDQNGHYLIHAIKMTDLNSKIEHMKPEIYESTFLDERIKSMKQLKYKKNMFDELCSRFSLFIQDHENIKEKIKELLEKNTITHFIKKMELRALLKPIVESITTYKEINKDEFDTLDIDQVELDDNGRFIVYIMKDKNVWEQNYFLLLEQLIKLPNKRQQYLDNIYVDKIDNENEFMFTSHDIIASTLTALYNTEEQTYYNDYGPNIEEEYVDFMGEDIQECEIGHIEKCTYQIMTDMGGVEETKGEMVQEGGSISHVFSLGGYTLGYSGDKIIW